jgi:hypothetical protein
LRFNGSNNASRLVAAGGTAVASISDATAAVRSGLVAVDAADAAAVVGAGQWRRQGGTSRCPGPP